MLGNPTGERMKLTATAVIVSLCAFALAQPSAWAQCEQQEIVRDCPDDYDDFGTSVAVDGDTLVVGAPGVDDPTGNAGAAYVYLYVEGKWVLRQTLHPDEVHASESFGYGVAISGDLMVVGARGYDEPEGNAGAAYVFRRDGLHWVQEQQLVASDGTEWDYFGSAVAVCGDVIAVGAPRADPYERGAVYLFRFDGSQWTKSYKQPGGWADSRLGRSLAACDDMVIAGEPYYEPGGSVRCFRDLGDAWTVTRITAPGQETESAFGYSVAMTADLFVAGALHDDDNGLSAGAAYVFRRDGDDWLLEQKLLASNGRPDEYFGTSVATDGHRIVVGAMQDDLPGRAYVYVFDGEQWQEEAELNSMLCSPEADLGSAAALHAETPIVAARFDDENANRSGSVHVFSLVGDDCNANGYCDWLDLLEGVSEDCNLNEVPDECDIAVPLDISSGILIPIGHGHPQHFSIEDPLRAIDDVVLDFHAMADLGDGNEWIDIDINGTDVGRVFQFDGSLCANPLDHSLLVVPAETFNDLIAQASEAVITMSASEMVNATACDGMSLISLHVIYKGRINDDNENGVPDECECPADFDGDGDVDTADLLFLLGAWGTPDGDVDFDGDTDTADLLALLAAWGECPAEKTEMRKAES
jgi:hypothetical protein